MSETKAQFECNLQLKDRIDLPEMGVILEDLLVGQFLVQEVVAVVQVLRDLAVELLYLLD